MKVAVTGSSGLIGSAYVKAAKKAGIELVRLVRRDPSPGQSEFRWDPEAGEIDEEGLAGVDAVVHLAGENIGARRWSNAQKARIRDSRVNGTKTISDAVARLDPRPDVLVCASALGYYGDRGDDVLTEDAPAGSDFLARVGVEWENASRSASEAGVRVVNLRFGLVIGRDAPLLTRQLPIFKLGLGGKLGSGRQFFSWISIDDAVRAISYAVDTPTLVGPVNVCSPNPVTNAEFTKTFGRVLSRPAIFMVPRFALKAAFGEMADTMFGSVRMSPTKLVESGFQFEHPDLEGALRHALGR
ncbi:MAG: TIGR01777 family protein [Chloroflexi bacterium]|nr:TIGR01777 family protein [Chloroflexota bacterium]